MEASKFADAHQAFVFKLPLDARLLARQLMVSSIVDGTPVDRRAFSFPSNRRPDWGMFGVSAAKERPSVKWRQIDLDKLSREKRDALLAAREEALGGGDEG